MKTLAYFSLLAFFLATSARAQATDPSATKEKNEPKEKVTMLVSDLRVERGVDPTLVGLLTEIALTEVNKTDAYVVVGYSDLRSLLEQASQEQALGCTNSECLVEVGAAAGADLILEMSLGRIGDEYILTGKLLTRSAKVEGRFTRQLAAEERGLVEAVKYEIRRLVGGEELPVRDPFEGELSASADNDSTWLWAMGTVAVLSAAGGVTFGLLARDEVVPALSPDFAERNDDAEQLALFANIGYGVAAVAATGFLVFCFWPSDTESQGESLTVTPSVAPNSAGFSLKVDF